MRPFVFPALTMLLAVSAAAQDTSRPQRSEEKAAEQHAQARTEEKKAVRSDLIQLEGEKSFSDKELRSQLKEQIATISDFGLTPARADDVAFFLELFYRKHGFMKASVHYVIESGSRLRLQINEGNLFTLGNVNFNGNASEPTDKLFDYVMGPTRERYSKLQKNLPFVSSDVEEGAELVHRFYVSEGFLDSKVEKPNFTFHEGTGQVDASISINEGRQFFFGQITFSGSKIYDAETLRGQIKDLLDRPFTDARVADIPRRLQSYLKTRGYFACKIEATPSIEAARDGRIPVQVAISAGALYHFGDASVTGLQKLHPSYVENRFRRLQGKTYSPEVLDEKFRTLMRSGLFSLLQINPVPEPDNTLHLEISAEEAKSKQLGFSAGYGTYEGLIGGIQFRELNLFGTGRPLTTSVEVSQRSYKGEILYEDPYLLETDLDMKTRAWALTFDYDGYSKFELGGSVGLSQKLTKQYEIGGLFSVRHVEVTTASIPDRFLGDTSYLINTFGFTQTLDLRDDPLVNPRGIVAANTVDVASSVIGSEVDLIRATFRVGYFIPFGPKPRSRLAWLRTRKLPPIFGSASGSNHRSLSARAWASCIRSIIPDRTSRPPFRSMNASSTAGARRCAASANVISARTIATSRSVASSSPSSMRSTPFRFSVNCRARFSLMPAICWQHRRNPASRTCVTRLAVAFVINWSPIPVRSDYHGVNPDPHYR